MLRITEDSAKQLMISLICYWDLYDWTAWSDVWLLRFACTFRDCIKLQRVKSKLRDYGFL